MTNHVTKGVILLAIDRVRGDRSIYGLYHLLNGKRSAQTIQDGHLFGLLPYFGLLSHLSRTEFEELIEELKKDDALTVNDRRVVVTAKGREELEEWRHTHTFLHYVDGWRWKNETKKAWMCLQLWLQALSNRVAGVTFYPVTLNEAVQQWVKRTIPHSPQARIQQLTRLHHELVELLTKMEEVQCEVLVRQLSGSTQIGQTLEQIAYNLGLSRSDVALIHTVSLQQIGSVVIENRERYPLIQSLFQSGEDSGNVLTNSAQKTWSMFRQGLSLEGIANARRLKRSTIEDHFVEIALHDETFSLRAFVPRDLEQEIIQIARTLNTKKLRPIRDQLTQPGSYFQIRLVLVKMEAVHEFGTRVT
ncbi:helix-turn-helix domain-containing protein [Halalkalibacterium halodurans]|uniref:Helicase Helix-turn-helix domain-containing protein n=1 Tax=Halalkalibacterium halodurans TaxID=86665 RepID=A0A0M0KLC4_ALKHA|nr:helix-turn-helix domain-containing protein [Halalkalibacterium halodurans]TPE70532.1 hypothetical protein AMD02_002900 [Halalkalibacterium halodurans]